MSKTIRVSDNVWERICALQSPRETIGEVLDRCLSTVEAIRTLPLGRPPIAPPHQRPGNLPKRSIAGLGFNTGDDESP